MCLKSFFNIILLAGIVSLACAGRSAASTVSNEATGIRRDGCRDLQAAYDRVIASNANDPTVAICDRRLAALDAATDDALKDLHAYRSKILGRSIATVDGSGEAAAEDANVLDAASIVKRYASAFETMPSLGGPREADRQAMDRYLCTAANILTTAIQSRAQACMAFAGTDATEILRLGFVLPLLTDNTGRSVVEPAPALPAWMTRTSALQVLRDFAVASSRPRLAYALARAGAGVAATSDLSGGYLGFVEEQANAMSRTARYAAALAALRDGIGVASGQNDQATVTQLSFRVAEVLDSALSAKDAADQMQATRSHCSGTEEYGRASVLYLRYLYSAGEYSALVTDASGDLNQPLCKNALPQIIYIAWGTCRRHGMDAAPWRDKFIERFPDHPLAAQIFMASAIDAIAQGKNQEALRVLEFIEYRFPGSKVIEQVRRIRGQLRSTSSTAASPGVIQP